MIQTTLPTAPEKKTSGGLAHHPDQPAFNCSFMTPANIKWYNFVLMTYQPAEDKPLVFVPCGSARKTRKGGKNGKNGSDSRKFISQSTSHQFLSAITRDDTLEKVILSEPLTLIPYSIEHHLDRPDYNLPPDFLSIQSEFIFIRQVSLWLAKLAWTQPHRKIIYYIGGKHHYFILHYANMMMNSPFLLLFCIPPLGIRDYAKSAKEIRIIIDEIESSEDPYITAEQIHASQPQISLAHYLKSRGRYTNKAFWETILVWQKDHHAQIDVCKASDRVKGFSDLYEQIAY